MKGVLWASSLFLFALPSWAMKNRYQDFNEPCDAVWKASVAIAKTEDYRIISIASDEKIISLAVGGFFAGERIITVSIAPAPEKGCRATVQSRFSGLAHSDGPDLLARIHVQLLASELGTDKSSVQQALQKFKSCMNGYNSSAAKCDAKLRKSLANEPGPSDATSSGWWNVSQPAEAKK